MNHVTRVSLWTTMAIAAVLIAIPFAIGLPGRAGAGQMMLDDLQPVMQPASVDTTARYFERTFVPLSPVAAGALQAAGETPKLIGALAGPLHMTPAQVQRFLATRFPATAGLLDGLPHLEPVFANVRPGLEHYEPLVTAVRANVGNYARVSGLPDLRLFTWALVVPGVLLALLAGTALLSTRRTRFAAVTPSTGPALP
jgi:hypothetical protein